MGVCICKSATVRTAAIQEPELEKYKLGDVLGCGRYGSVNFATSVDAADKK